MCVCASFAGCRGRGNARSGRLFFFVSLAGNLKQKLTLLRDSCVRMGLQQRVRVCVSVC